MLLEEKTCCGPEFNIIWDSFFQSSCPNLNHSVSSNFFQKLLNHILKQHGHQAWNLNSASTKKNCMTSVTSQSELASTFGIFDSPPNHRWKWDFKNGWVLIQMCLISHSECVTKKIKYHLPVLNKSWKFFLIDLFIVGNPFSISFLIIFRPRSKMVVPMFYTAHPQVFVHPPPSTSCKSCTSRVFLLDPPRLYCFYNQEMITICIHG